MSASQRLLVSAALIGSCWFGSSCSDPKSNNALDGGLDQNGQNPLDLQRSDSLGSGGATDLKGDLGPTDGAAGGDLIGATSPDLLGASGDLWMDDPGAGPSQQCSFTPDTDGFFTLTSSKADYWVRLPNGYDVDNPTPTRLFVAIHGCGDTAYNFATWGAVPWEIRDTHDYIGISLGGRDGECWNMSTDGPIVLAAIDHVRSCFYVHQKKIVIGGYSSGGMLSYNVGLKNAALFAGILIENSGLSEGVGSSNVDKVLTDAAWKLNIAHTARTEDQSFDILSVQSDRDKILAHGFPLQYRELAGPHDGTSQDWYEYLLPKMADWRAP